MEELIIDPEFRDKIPPLTQDEYEQLRENILADGEVYEPICVWNGTIVDGHNRWKIIKENPNIVYRIREMEFSDKNEAFDWMYKKQLGRRNLSDENKIYLWGKIYEARKAKHGGDRKSSSQIGNLKPHGRIGDQIAKELGVGHGTVVRAEKFAKGVDALREISPTAANNVLKGGSGVKKAEMQEFSKMEKDDQIAFAKQIEDGVLKGKRDRQRKTQTTEDVARRKEMLAMIKEFDKKSSDLSHTSAYTIDDLLNELEINGNGYFTSFRQTLINHSTLLVDDNKEKIVNKIDEVIKKFESVKEIIR